MELTQEVSFSNQIKKIAMLISELGKFRITFFVSVTTSFGYILYSEKVTLEMLLTSFAVFLMASGASAINQVQEKEIDKNMHRTRFRPIPLGLVNVSTVMFFGSFLLLVGALFLYFFIGIIPFYLGLFTFTWYNFVYTPLKKVTAFAIIPGSIVGAIPPIIGWTAAGGNIFHITSLSVGLFFFIWQVPHFWMLLMIYSDEYKKAGFPVLTDIFNTKQLGRISFVWIIGLGFSSYLLIVYESIFSYYSAFYATVSFASLLYFCKSLLSGESDKKNLRMNFISINIYVLLIITIISIDKLIL